MILTESIGIGLVLSFFFYELTGLTAGGFVVPGYFALYWGQPLMMAIALVTALITFGLVRIVSQVSILYGRRRFTVMVITGFACHWIMDSLLTVINVANIVIDPIGYIIPGLVANEMDRQGVTATLLSLIAVSAGVRIILLALGHLRPW